jgi:hypothetical protein
MLLTASKLQPDPFFGIIENVNQKTLTSKIKLLHQRAAACWQSVVGN